MLLNAEGTDSGPDYDGCLEYLGNVYLPEYGTKYNRDQSDSALLYPRVRFKKAMLTGKKRKL
jgi:hypothetical protein